MDSFGTSENFNIPSAADQDFLLTLARTFDKHAAQALNDKEGALWQIFARVLGACLAEGERYVISAPASRS